MLKKNIIFSVPIKKIRQTLSYRVKFIDSAGSMVSSLSNPVNNLA